MHGLQLLPQAEHAVQIALAAIGLALVPVVLLQRKEPASTAAWILTLVFIPVVGAVLFLMFGRDRVRWPARRKREIDRIVGDRVEASRDETVPSGHPSGDETAGPQAALFRLGARLCGGRVTHGNGVDVLIDGTTTYQAMGDAIDRARHHVHAQFYLVRDDATGLWFRDRLVAAARRGVIVRLLLDGYGSFALSSGWRRTLRQSGAKVAAFMPMHSALLQPVNLRNHRKILITDGATAFTGGFNVGDEYKGTMRGVGQWRDVHLCIRGPAAAELQRIFFQDWAFATGEIIAPDAYFREKRADEGSATVVIVPSGPDTRNEAIHRLFFGAIVGGERDISITTPYFVPTESIRVAMELAAMRGIDIKIVLPGRSNHRVTLHAGRSFYAQLLRAGVDIREYEPGLVHAKTLIVDSQVALVGSANMDLRSFRLNFEVHALVHDGPTADKLRAAFAEALGHCRRIDEASWSRRPVSQRMREGAARLVSPLL